MNSSRKNNEQKPKSVYDDDFEVTYEEDLPINEPSQKSKSTKPEKGQRATFHSGSYYEEKEDDIPSSSKKEDRQNTKLAAPIQKGGRQAYRLSRTIARNFSSILILGIMIFLVYNFWRGSAPYGDIQDAFSTQELSETLFAYIAVVILILVYELFSLIWTMTKVRMHDEYGVFYADTGRGLFSFIFLYLFSYAAFLLQSLISESTPFLQGIKGAVDVFGSLHNALFGFCLAGVLACLYRKYSH